MATAITLYCKHPGCTKKHRYSGSESQIVELLEKVPMRGGAYHYLCPQHRRKHRA